MISDNISEQVNSIDEDVKFRQIEQQLKLLIDNMQAKLDEYENNEGVSSSPQNNKRESASIKVL